MFLKRIDFAGLLKPKTVLVIPFTGMAMGAGLSLLNQSSSVLENALLGGMIGLVLMYICWFIFAKPSEG